MKERLLSCVAQGRRASQLKDEAEGESCLHACIPQLHDVPEGDEAGVEKWEEEHARNHPPKPIVNAQLPPPDFCQKGL